MKVMEARDGKGMRGRGGRVEHENATQSRTRDAHSVNVAGPNARSGQRETEPKLSFRDTALSRRVHQLLVSALPLPVPYHPCSL